MIIPDINQQVYAYDSAVSQHGDARRWWEGLLNGAEAVGLPWAVSTGFIKLMTNSRAVSMPLLPVEAAGYVSGWFECSHVLPVNPGARHLEHFRRNLAVTGSGTNLVADAHIAALAMEYDAELHSNDSDFDRFPGLRWRNPLP